MAIRTCLLGLFIGAFCSACDSEVSSPATVVPQVVAASESVPGIIVFTIGDIEHEYEFLPNAANFYLSVASAVSAKPAYDAPEALTVNFLYTDIETLEYPSVFRNNAGIIYIDSEGTEWAGPAHITLESFGADGILRGGFTNVSLPHTEKSLPNVVLNDGRFEVQLGGR